MAAYRRFMMSGGPPPDGIPSIDSPRFLSAAEARLDPGDMVIGYHRGGEARAYPQKIMVHREIVNDRIDGLNIAITYCPLTATAQGFERGASTLGVSGQLLNNPLGGYYRQEATIFPLMHASGRHGKKEMVVGARTADRSVTQGLRDSIRRMIYLIRQDHGP